MIKKIILANIATFAVCYLFVSFTEMDWFYLFSKDREFARFNVCFLQICATILAIFLCHAEELYD